jgi:hypothetical protein
MPAGDTALLKHLSARSAGYRDPLQCIDWQALDAAGGWLPDAALSLYGLPEYDAVAPAVRRRLGQYEFINTLCCGLWLESLFLQRLAQELHSGMARTEYEYVLHQLREESGHSLMFLRVIEASGLPLPEGAWRCPALTAAVARRAPVKGDFFWLAMLIGEHVPDTFNRWLRRQAGVHPVVAQVCSVHVADEARHIAYARNGLERPLPACGPAKRRMLSLSARVLLARLARLFYFPSARFYELAGLDDGAAWRRKALSNPVRARFVEERLRPTAKLLAGYGLHPLSSS